LPFSEVPITIAPTMTRRYRITEDSASYFLTSTTVWWTPIFISNLTCDVLINSLAYCQKDKGLRIHGYVVMPNHFHLVVTTPAPNSLSPVIRDLKRYTSRELTRVLEESSWELPVRIFRKTGMSSGTGRKYKVWQDEFHPVAVFSEEVFRVKLDYLHQNPVRKGLVRKASDWWYSSAGFYETGEMGPLKVDEVEF